MMTVTTHLKLRMDCLLRLLSLLVLLSLVGRCQAQNSGVIVGFFAIPIVLFIIGVSVMCAIFWICYCRHQRAQQGYNAPAAALYTSYNPQRPYYGADTQPAYPVQGYILPSSTTPCSLPSAQTYPGQAYIPPSAVTVPNIPSDPPETTAQTVPQSVSLPEATLHEGDAPPAYKDAIGMKTVNTAGQDKQWT